MSAVSGLVIRPFKAIVKWCSASSRRLVALLVVGVLVVAAALAALLWPEFRVGGPPAGGAEPLSATVRNLALIVAGIVAVILTVWRIRVSEQQAEIARLGLLNERFQRGAEMLGSPVVSVRMGGIHALDDLARERPELYHIRVILLLCAFVRHPTGFETNPGAQPISEGATRWYKLRPDVRAAIEAVAHRSVWVPIIRSWALTRGFALHPGTRNRYEIRYTRTQHRPPIAAGQRPRPSFRHPQGDEPRSRNAFPRISERVSRDSERERECLLCVRGVCGVV